MHWIEGESGRFAAFPLGDGDHDPVVVIVEYAPGCVIGAHHHRSDYFSMVLRGEMDITRRHEEVGAMRHVRATTVYGPLVVGPEGCTVLEVFEDRKTFVEPHFTSSRSASAPVSASALAPGVAAAEPMPVLFALALEQARAHFGGQLGVHPGGDRARQDVEQRGGA